MRPPGAAGPRLTPDDVSPAGRASFDNANVLRRIFLQFDEANWEDELAAFHNSDVDVPATITVGRHVYRYVDVHFRGRSSFMMACAGTKRSLNLSFDFAHEDLRLLGYRTLNLVNVNGDTPFLRPVLYADISGRYIAAPEANHVRVALNGE